MQTQTLEGMNTKIQALKRRAQSLQQISKGNPVVQQQVKYLYQAIADTLKSQAEMEKRLVDLKYRTKIESIKQQQSMNTSDRATTRFDSNKKQPSLYRHSLLGKENAVTSQTDTKALTNRTASKNKTATNQYKDRNLQTYETTPFQQLLYMFIYPLLLLRKLIDVNHSGNRWFTSQKILRNLQPNFEPSIKGSTSSKVQLCDYKPCQVDFPQFLNASKDSVALVEEYMRGDKAKQFQEIVEQCRRNGELITEQNERDIQREYASPVEILASRSQGRKTPQISSTIVEEPAPPLINVLPVPQPPAATLESFIRNNYQIKAAESFNSTQKFGGYSFVRNRQYPVVSSNNREDYPPEAVKRKVAYETEMVEPNSSAFTPGKQIRNTVNSREMSAVRSANRIQSVRISSAAEQRNRSKSKSKISNKSVYFQEESEDSLQKNKRGQPDSPESDGSRRQPNRRANPAIVAAEATKRIQNRLQQSWALYEDSTFKNVKHQREHLFNTFAKELKFRSDIIAKMVQQARKWKYEW